MKALITGASTGIGKDMAIYLGLLGFDLVLVARDEKKLEEVKEQINTNVEIIPMDLSLAENCLELYRKIGKVDVLINNAGYGIFGEFTKTSLIEEINLINLNILAVHTLTKLFIEDMEEQNFGYIMNVSSIAGYVPGPLMSSYYASKAYVLNLTYSIAAELKKQNSGISISCLCPGPTHTPFMEKVGIKFEIPAYKSSFVAKYAIDKMLRGKTIIIPGIKIKILMGIVKILPKKLIATVLYKIQKQIKSEKTEENKKEISNFENSNE